MNRRVVVSGMGVITPIGIGCAAFSSALRSGSSGAGPVTSFSPHDHPVKLAYEVKGFNPHEHHTHVMDPFIQYAIAATAEAVRDSGVKLESMDPFRIGISVSSSKGGVRTIDRFKERFTKKPSAILGARIYSNSVPNFAAQWIARRWKIKGPAKCYVAACATGTVAVLEGARMIREGVVDLCAAGSSDASITPLMLAGYHNMKALDPEGLRPFDKYRRGFSVGEGAGILILESEESARNRGVRIYGEIAGGFYASSCADAIHFKDDALQTALNGLMKRTGWRPEEIDYMNLHGTGTQTGDRYETLQIKKAFGSAAYRIPASSTKSMTGHLLGAAGSVEAAAVLLAMRDGFIPPTIRLEHPDPDCDLDYTPNQARSANIQKAISISMGFGGHVAVMALERYDGRTS